MEQTPEGLAVAAATREAIKRKRQEEAQPAQDAPAPKKTSRPPPTCLHEVMLPEGFDASTINLDPQVFGAWLDGTASPIHHTKPFALFLRSIMLHSCSKP